MVYLNQQSQLMRTFLGVPKEAGELAEECSNRQDLECKAQWAARRGVTAYITQNAECLLSACVG